MDRRRSFNVTTAELLMLASLGVFAAACSPAAPSAKTRLATKPEAVAVDSPLPAAPAEPATTKAPAPDSWSARGSRQGLPEARLELWPIASGAVDAPFEVAPFADGALIANGSLLAIVNGAAVTQDPAWLSGLPEYLNWDVRVGVGLPDGAVLQPRMLPKGAWLSMLAGNRHGPGGDFVWSGKRWLAGARARDPRVAALLRSPAQRPEVSAEALVLATGQALVVRDEAGAAYSYAFEHGATRPTRTLLPLRNVWDGGMISLAAASLHDAYLCTPEAAVHFDGTRWLAIDLPPGMSPWRCAVTQNGTLWVHTNTDVLLRTPAGEWQRVALPPGTSPRSIVAAGNRVWLVVEGAVLSTQPVDRPLQVAPAELPLQWSFGLTGLDSHVPEVPNLSADPPGPATSACTATAIYLGRELSAENRAALGALSAARGATLVEARSRAKGRIVFEGSGGANLRVIPSSRSVPAFALIPADPTSGPALRAALATAPLDGLEPKLLCTLPHVVKRTPLR